MDKKKESFLAAYLTAMGNTSTACYKSDINRSTFKEWMQDPAFAKRIKEIDKEKLDFVEGKLLSLIEAGDTTAIKFYLQTKGKKRGYGVSPPPPPNGNQLNFTIIKLSDGTPIKIYE